MKASFELSGPLTWNYEMFGRCWHSNCWYHKPPVGSAAALSLRVFGADTRFTSQFRTPTGHDSDRSPQKKSLTREQIPTYEPRWRNTQRFPPPPLPIYSNNNNRLGKYYTNRTFSVLHWTCACVSASGQASGPAPSSASSWLTTRASGWVSRS